MWSRITTGILLGLVVGKPVGITLAAWVAVRLGATLPATTSLRHVAGVGAVAGIGFTMSLFVAGLAFDDDEALEKPDRAPRRVAGGSMAGGAGLWRSAEGGGQPQPGNSPTAGG